MLILTSIKKGSKDDKKNKNSKKSPNKSDRKK